MRILAVIAERFAVIRGDCDEGCRAGSRDQVTRCAIDSGNLAVVRRGRESFLQIGRRIVRIVGIVEMHPQEPRSASSRRQPLSCPRGHLLAAPLDSLIPIVSGPTQPKAGVVHIEASIEAGRGAVARIENQRSDERCRPIAGVAQQRREIRHRCGQRRSEVVHVMKRREGTRQDRRVRDRRDRRLSVGVREHDSRPRERVERRRQPARRPEKSHPVGACRVKSNKEYVSFGG